MALMKKGCKLDVLLGKKKVRKSPPPYPPWKRDPGEIVGFGKKGKAITKWSIEKIEERKSSMANYV